MKFALTVVMLVVITSSVAFAGDWQEALGTVVQTYQVLKGARSAEPGEPSPVSYQIPQRRADGRQFPLEWKRDDTPGGLGIVDASAIEYWGGWSHSGMPNETVKASVETVGAQMGLPFSPDDRQVQDTQDRVAKPGYDPRYATSQGRQIAPKGVIQVTVTWAGYTKVLKGTARYRNQEVRRYEETYKVTLTATVTNLMTGLSGASARADGSSKATFSEGSVESWGYSVGVEQSQRARPDEACRQAAMGLMAQLSSQLLGRGCEQQAGLVVAGVNGLTLYLTTTDNSEVRDAGLVEGFRYAVRGGGMLNPVTHQPVAGQAVLCVVEVVDIDGAMATARITVESTDVAARLPQLIREGDRVTLVPYQSLHVKGELER